MQRKTRLRPEALELEGEQNPDDRPGCPLLGCRERCGRIHQQLVSAPQRWAIFCPRGWAMVTSYPEPDTHYVCRTDFERFQVFLRMAQAEAGAQRALGEMQRSER